MHRLGLAFALALSCKSRGAVEPVELPAPKIVVAAGTIAVDDATFPTPTPSGAPIALMLAQLAAERDRWVTAHPGQDFTASATLTVAPALPAQLALDALRTIASADYPHARFVVGSAAVELDLAPTGSTLVVTRFVGRAADEWDIDFFLAGDSTCSVILESTTWNLTEQAPVGLRGTTLPDTKPGAEQLLVVPRPSAPASELAALLVQVEATPLMKTLHPKLRFDWTLHPCPSDGKFGHAN